MTDIVKENQKQQNARSIQPRSQSVAWKLQSSHRDSSIILQKVLSHSPVSSFFSLIHRATCIIRRGISQSLHRLSTLSSSSRGREVLLNRGPQASLSLEMSSICSKSFGFPLMDLLANLT